MKIEEVIRVCNNYLCSRNGVEGVTKKLKGTILAITFIHLEKVTMMEIFFLMRWMKLRNWRKYRNYGRDA